MCIDPPLEVSLLQIVHLFCISLKDLQHHEQPVNDKIIIKLRIGSNICILYF